MSAGVEGPRSWESLRHALESPRVALIFHCRNHYAGIFAMREWAEGVSNHGTTWHSSLQDGSEFSSDNIVCRQGRTRRQILTNTAGQAPAVWMPWEDVAEIMRKWKGYRVLALSRQGP